MHRLFVPTQTGPDLWGVVDDDGKVLIPPIYTFISDFESGSEFPISVQSADGKWGYVTANGAVVIKPTLQQARSFTEEGIARYQKDEKWGFIRQDGSYLSPPKYDAASYFSNGFAAVKVGDFWTYIDTSGKQVFDQKFVVAGAFSSGEIAAVATSSSKKIGLINRQGDWVVKPVFKEVRSFSKSGHIGVRVGDVWGIVDSAGKWIVKPKYYDLGYFDESNIAEFQIEYGHGGLINDSGKVLLDLGEQRFYELNYADQCGLAHVQYDSSVMFYSLVDGKPVPTLNQQKYKLISEFNNQCRAMVLFAGTDGWARLEASGARHELPKDVLEPYFIEGNDSTSMAYAQGKYVPVVLRDRSLAYIDYDGVIALHAEMLKHAKEDVLLIRDANGKELWRQTYVANTLIVNNKHPAFLNKGHQEFGYAPQTQEQLRQHVEKLQSQTPTAFRSDEKNLTPGSGDSFGTGVQLAYAHYNYADHASTYWYAIKYPDFTVEFQETKAKLTALYGPALEKDDVVDSILEMNEIYGDNIAAWNLGENILVLQDNRYEDGDVDYWGVLNLLVLPTPESTRAALNLPIIPLADVNLSPHSDPDFIAALKEIYDKLDRDSGVELHPSVMAVLTQLQSGKSISADDYIRTQYALLKIAYFEDDEPQIGTEIEYIALLKHLMRVIEDHGLGKDLLTAVGQFRIDTYIYAANDAAWMLRDADPSAALSIIERAVPFLTERNSDEWDTYIRVLVSAGQQPKAFEVLKRILDENPWHTELADFYDDKAYRQWLKKNGGQVINSESLPTSADTVRNKQDIAVHNESGRLAIA